MQNTKKLERAVKRRSHDFSKPVKTDQSFKKLCDINNIVKQFHKTGVLPTGTRQGAYGDFSQPQTLEDSFDVVIQAKRAFLELPSFIRKMIDNDPSKLVSFIADEQNYDLCVKHGLIEKKPEPVAQEKLLQPEVKTTENTEVKNETETGTGATTN